MWLNGRQVVMVFVVVLSLEVHGAEFRQRFEAVYRTPEAAKRAVVSAADLPPGKRFAFSQRWDDANPRHRKMADTLEPLGIKATFYVNGGYGREFVPLMTNLLARGHSIGDHTVSHPNVAKLPPFEQFREIMAQRIRLECDSQSPVVAFSIPYGAVADDTDRTASVRYGTALSNAGLLGSPQSERDIARTFGLGSSRWVGAHYFSINDKAPDAERFRKGMNGCTNAALRADSVYGPHVTMGTHTWQRDEGFVVLSNILSTVAHRPDIWFVNENEWIAARLQRLLARFATVSVMDCRAVYEVTRPEPADLGAVQPLYLSFSEDPVSVRCAEMPQADVLKDGMLAGQRHGLPAHYRMLESGALTVDEDLRKAICTVTNDTDETWRRIDVTLRLPPGFKPGVLTRSVGPLRAGAVKHVSFALDYRGEPRFRAGRLYAALQVDVHGKEGLERRWADCTVRLADGAR